MKLIKKILDMFQNNKKKDLNSLITLVLISKERDGIS